MILIFSFSKKSFFKKIISSNLNLCNILVIKRLHRYVVTNVLCNFPLWSSCEEVFQRALLSCALYFVIKIRTLRMNKILVYPVGSGVSVFIHELVFHRDQNLHSKIAPSVGWMSWNPKSNISAVYLGKQKILFLKKYELSLWPE